MFINLNFPIAFLLSLLESSLPKEMSCFDTHDVDFHPCSDQQLPGFMQ